MSPLQRLINEGIPDGTYGQADHAPWTPATQFAHRLVLEEAISGWTWVDDPKSHSRRDAA
ncbi:hypothetical protein ACWCQM_11675 [Streptomyces sp. NPDC002125]